MQQQYVSKKTVHFTDAELLQKGEERAQEEGLSFSDWVITLISRAIVDNTQQPDASDHKEK